MKMNFFCLRAGTAGIIFFTVLSSCGLNAGQTPTTESSQHRAFDEEIIYHIFLRSFYDSNADGDGDLEGVRLKLDYLQELGVTALLLTPLYDSDFYHNYFPNDFEKIDSEYGSLEDYLRLVKDIHARDMKLFMDVEIQYVTEKHPWYRDSFGNPTSPFSDYIIYNGPENTDPESGIFNIKDLPGYDGNSVRIATANMKNESLRAYHSRLLQYWLDPNGDGNFVDGVDGFRIDHIMDDLDDKGILTNLLSEFWKPTFDELRAVNPGIVIIGEQADWGYGEEYLVKADIDAVFAFPPRFAMLNFDKREIESKADSMALLTPAGKYAITFIENHDTDRVASEVDADEGKMRAAAVLNILTKGTPLIYYGQELGMKGEKGDWGHDGNDIPRREAFEWNTTVNSNGMTLWYRDSGPWWDQSSLKDADGISAEEQMNDPNSLWTHYRKLIALRKEHPSLMQGTQRFLQTDQSSVLAFERAYHEEKALVVVNLSDEKVRTQVSIKDEDASVELEAYGYQVTFQ